MDVYSSICGPFIWNLIIDDLMWKQDECGCKCVVYDLLLIVKGRNCVEVERKSNEWMGIVSEWGENVGVKVSKGKIVVVLMKGSVYDNLCRECEIFGNMSG